jgi:hypothetical protein
MIGEMENRRMAKELLAGSPYGAVVLTLEEYARKVAQRNAEEAEDLELRELKRMLAELLKRAEEV